MASKSNINESKTSTPARKSGRGGRKNQELKVPFIYDFSDIQFAPKIESKCYLSQTIKNLKEVLSSEEWRYFNEDSQFRHIFHLKCDENMKMLPVSVLLHRTLKLEEEKGQLWFVLNGVPIRYSITEHAIISGLKCNQYPEDWEGRRKSDFRIKTFGPGKVTRKAVMEKLQKSKHSRIDRKRLVTLMLLSGVLDPENRNDDSINHDLVDMVDELELCEEFPWGRYSFDKLVEQLRKILQSPTPKGRWRLTGFVVPLM
ncbi:PREDICTED: uncharacterized protein At3g43530-like, partial [Tarenaya hassleriana]|uniref:uncharacterized protein At3g43530-like n=1 Tax=Tarenaya hassleriana TaxID=28532 RepID=UPI00053CA05F